MSLFEWMAAKWFGWVHGNNLVYNQCWEDPRLDRVALNLTPDDSVLVITSAGCNVLDYALCNPKNVYAVDMNPRQNAVLELKMAGIRELEFEAFFNLFGRGRLLELPRLYDARLRRRLSPPSRAYWDKHLHFFSDTGFRKSFYFHGTSGYFAWLVNIYLNRKPGLRNAVEAILGAQTLEEQRDVYYNWVSENLWNRPVRWAVGRDTTLAMVGVPRAQRQQVERHYEGGIAQFIEDCIETVFASLPLGDNYFWRVYLTGEYTKECCPEYLKEENFERLKGGQVDCVSVHTDTVEGFLRRSGKPISRFVLLDHMDWLYSHHRQALTDEWQAIVDRASADARIIWRSGGMKVDFVDPLVVRLDNAEQRLGELLTYHDDLAAGLHRQDRVHTYGSFYIADLATT